MHLQWNSLMSYPLHHVTLSWFKNSPLRFTAREKNGTKKTNGRVVWAERRLSLLMKTDFTHAWKVNSFFRHFYLLQALTMERAWWTLVKHWPFLAPHVCFHVSPVLFSPFKCVDWAECVIEGCWHNTTQLHVIKFVQIENTCMSYVLFLTKKKIVWTNWLGEKKSFFLF